MSEKRQILKNHGSYTFVKEDHTTPVNEYSNVMTIRKLTILIIFTGGFYGVYWFYKNSKYLQNTTTIFRTIGLFIPILNLYIYYKYLKSFNDLIKEKNLKSFNVILNLIMFFFIPILNLWSIINVQDYINNYWRKTQPHLADELSFTASEKVGLAAIILIEIAYFALLFLMMI